MVIYLLLYFVFVWKLWLPVGTVGTRVFMWGTDSSQRTQMVSIRELVMPDDAPAQIISDCSCQPSHHTKPNAQNTYIVECIEQNIRHNRKVIIYCSY